MSRPKRRWQIVEALQLARGGRGAASRAERKHAKAKRVAALLELAMRHFTRAERALLKAQRHQARAGAA